MVKKRIYNFDTNLRIGGSDSQIHVRQKIVIHFIIFDDKKDTILIQKFETRILHFNFQSEIFYELINIR